MSYDLLLAFPIKPESDSIRAAATKAGLTVRGSEVLTFLDAKGQQVFTADGPYRVEAEDVEDKVLAVLSDPHWGMLISRPAASGEEGIRQALIVARAIAGANRGTVYDPQTEKLVFPLRAVAKNPPTEGRVRLLHLSWLLPQNVSISETASTWLRLVRQYFPQAVPSRYGTTEPMQQRLVPGAENAFFTLWETTSREVVPWVLFKSAAPCFGGDVFLLGPGPNRHRPIEIQLEFDGDYLESNEANRHACVELFGAVARELGCFYAAGFVERDWVVSRRRLGTDGRTETLHVLRKSEWLGLPPFPVWLSWYGSPYKERVRSSLRGVAFEEHPKGLLLRLGEMPQDIDQLEGRFPVLPPELCRQPLPPPPARPGITIQGTDFSSPAKTLMDLTGSPTPE